VPPRDSAWAVFRVFWRLGLTSFGGPVAHLGFFRAEFVARRRWLTEQAYADLVALCQFLPGPASSQVGMALGLLRAGYPGALAAWLGFTLPSALLLAALGAGLTGGDLSHPATQGALHGLKVAAVAVVAHAVWGMARSLCPGAVHRALMGLAATLALWQPSAWVPVGLVVLGACAGVAWLQPHDRTPAHRALAEPLSRHAPSARMGLVWLLLFAAGLVGLPWVAQQAFAPGGQALWLVLDAFYRTGALVFGGGHVVLPLLQAEVVAPGWVDSDTFLTGYAAAQAVPGPLFTLAAFLGAAMPGVLPAGVGAVAAVVGVFAPSFLLVAGALPFWADLRQRPLAQAALGGANAVVVGLLLAALVHPVATSALWPLAGTGVLANLPWWAMAAMAALATTALLRGQLPAWGLVAVCAGVGALLGSGQA